MILIGHDWGGTLAFDWAARHPERVAGLAFLEAIVKPMARAELSPESLARFESARGPDGEQMIVEQDLFIRSAYTGGVLTPVGPEDLDAYLVPYPTPESRRPVLAWVRERPLDGEPADVVERIDGFDTWLATSQDIPKLLMTFEGPGLIVNEHITDWCVNHIAALEIVRCGQAGHHAPEDRPQEIASAVAIWVDRHQLRD